MNRYGYSSDIGAVFIRTTPAFNYVSGLFFTPALIFLVFLTWIVLLLALKYCCKDKIIGGARLIKIQSASRKQRNCRMFLCLVTIAIISFCSNSLSRQTELLGLVFDKARTSISVRLSIFLFAQYRTCIF